MTKSANIILLASTTIGAKTAFKLIKIKRKEKKRCKKLARRRARRAGKIVDRELDKFKNVDRRDVV